MNGAVQGDATATASTPVRNASARAWPLRAAAMRAGSNEPNSNTPDRLSASTRNSEREQRDERRRLQLEAPADLARRAPCSASSTRGERRETTATTPSA